MKRCRQRFLLLGAAVLPLVHGRIGTADAQEQPPLVAVAPAPVVAPPRPPAPARVIVFSSMVAIGGTSLLAGAFMLGYGDYQKWNIAPDAPTVMTFVRLRDQGDAIQTAGGAMMVVGTLATVIGAVGLSSAVPKWRKMAFLVNPTASGLAVVGGGSF